MSVSNDTAIAVDGVHAEDHPGRGAHDRGRRRVTVELGVILALIAGAWTTRWIDGCVPVYRADIEPIPGCISAAGGMIYSRHPVMSSDVPPVPDTTFEAPVATIDAPGGPVVVLAAHPVPPWPVDSRRWHAEMTALATWAADTADGPPLVIAGDMNASEAHPALRRFGDAGMYDAQREVGAGPVRTWPRIAPFPFPWFHIDHVLVRGLGVADAGTVVLPGSDHDAVWAALAPAAGDVLGAQANRTATASSHN
jgi:hypothetical protein